MLHINNNTIELVLYILTGYQMLGIVCLDQLSGARHTHNILSQYLGGDAKRTWWYFLGPSFIFSNFQSYDANINP